VVDYCHCSRMQDMASKKSESLSNSCTYMSVFRMVSMLRQSSQVNSVVHMHLKLQMSIIFSIFKRNGSWLS
ncbi:MAG: hypothetical protein ACOVKJ_06630, partial [Flavobacterium sp.]